MSRRGGRLAELLGDGGAGAPGADGEVGGPGAGIGEEDCEAEAAVGACYEDGLAGAGVGCGVYLGVGVVVDLGGEGEDWSLLVSLITQVV